MYQKFFSARTEKDATQAVVGWFIGIVILESVIVALAVVGSALFRTGEVHENPREILAYTALNALPHVLGAIMVGAIFAKVISTANNYLFSPATNLINDVFVRYIRPDASNRSILLISRVLVVLLGCWSLFQSLGTSSVLEKALYAYTIYSAALTPVILAAFFWKRATAAGAVASIAAGTVVTVLWATKSTHESLIAAYLPTAYADRDAIFPALIVSLLCLVLVSLATRRPSQAQLAPFDET